MSGTGAPYGILLSTDYGPMIVNRHDLGQTGALLATGRAPDHAEIETLRTLAAGLGGNVEFLDVGANVGSHALALAGHVGPAGSVHAFEPQRILCNMIAGSVALNGLLNVHCHNVAVGGEEGIVEVPQFDYRQPLSFGRVEFGAAQQEPLEQQRRHDPMRVEYVRVVTLDSYQFQRAKLIKIDVEGMDAAVVEGALETIQRCRPVLLIAVRKVDGAALRQRVEALGYVAHGTGDNVLFIPQELSRRFQVSA